MAAPTSGYDELRKTSAGQKYIPDGSRREAIGRAAYAGGVRALQAATGGAVSATMIDKGIKYRTKIQRNKRKLYKIGAVGLALALVASIFVVLQALGFAGTTTAPKTAINCGAGPTSVASATGTGSPSGTQTANARTIIGVAKTLGLSQTAQIVGIMVSMDESSLTDLANSTVPVSLSSPNAQGSPGHNADSVGLFQQRPSTGWSTIASGAAADSTQQAVWQLMTPAYSAEAFFGLPASSGAPSAVTKGLQDHAGWTTMAPWAAAEAVQASATSAGMNYHQFYSQAQSLVSANSSAPAVPLPIKATGAPSGGQGGGTTVTVGAKISKVLIVGDSITVRGQSGLTSQLKSDGITATFHDKVGARLSTFAATVPGWIQKTHPNLLVMALGTNDWGSGSGYGATVSSFLGTIGNQSTLWVLPYYQDLRAPETTNASGIATDLQQLDASVQGLTASHKNLQTLDMNAAFGTNPAYITSTGLHPSIPVGTQMWATTMAQGITGNNGVLTSVSTGACSGTVLVSSNGAYHNPLRSTHGLVPERIDAGVDYAGTGPVYAIGTAVVVNTTGHGWPGNHVFISYTLTDGPAVGKTVYVAECMTAKVHVGTKINANTIVGTMTNCGSGIETGWAQPPSSGCTDCAMGKFNQQNSTSYGMNFSELLASTGAPAGIPMAGVPTTVLPSNWPAWAISAKG